MNALGDLGERKAADYLIDQEYTVIDWNVYAQGGEIDLVCQNKHGHWVFVEVKTRTNHSFGGAVSAVSVAKFTKILKAIEHYFLRVLKLSDMPEFQIDIVCLQKEGDNFAIEHFENVGEGDF